MNEYIQFLFFLLFETSLFGSLKSVELDVRVRLKIVAILAGLGEHEVLLIRDLFPLPAIKIYTFKTHPTTL